MGMGLLPPPSPFRSVLLKPQFRAGDFNGDGNQDIAVTYSDNDMTSSFPLTIVTAYMGDGDGTFSATIVPLPT